MADALTPEQIELLRSLPITTKTVLTDRKKTVKCQELIRDGLAENVDPDSSRRFWMRRTAIADTLLATLDAHQPNTGSEDLQFLVDNLSLILEDRSIDIQNTKLRSQLSSLTDLLAAALTEEGAGS